MRRKVTILSSVHLALDNRVFYREARSLVKGGYEVTLIAAHDRDEVRDGVHIRPLPRVQRSRRPLQWRRLLQMARETSADIYHIHDPELLILTPWLRRLTGKPTIYDIHEANADFIAVKDYLPVLIRNPLANLFRKVEPCLAAHENGLIFADDAIAQAFTGFSGPKTTLFNFPGDDLIQLGTTTQTHYELRPPIILYLGGLERNRGASLMLESFARVRGHYPDARLLIVGHCQPPELADEILACAQRAGFDNYLTMTGRIPFAHIHRYLSQARVGWVTWQAYAKNEKNIPTKLFEYMAFGLPVVSSELQSVRPFVLAEQNGLLVPPDDAEAHAGAIIRLLSNPTEARRMGAVGRRLVEDCFNWTAMEPRLLAFYDQVLSGRN